MQANQTDKKCEWITIQNCNEHNLRNVTLKIPLGKLTLICGVSGSGKSTLAHDVCFSEGQGRFLETFPAYTRIFQTRLNRSHTKHVDNIPPALALEQVFLSHNPRSTVATLSDLYSSIRLLYSRFSLSQDSKRPSRSHLSFNHPLGACPVCQGLGQVYCLDHDRLIRDESSSLREGALHLSTSNAYIMYSQVTIDVLNQVCQAHGFSVDIPWNELEDEQKKVVLYGSNRLKIPFGKHPLESRLKWTGITAKPRGLGTYRGIIPVMEEILKRDPNANILRWCKQDACPACQGLRLNSDVHHLVYQDTFLKTVLTFCISELASWGENILGHTHLSQAEAILISSMVAHARLLDDLCLGHLELLRSVPSLSPGEVQGIRLASLLKNPISDVLYVMDEPASSLHPLEKIRVYKHIRSLLKHQCTILLVSHDRTALNSADWVVEMGPGGGSEGGQLLFSGSAASFQKKIESESPDTPSSLAWSRQLPVLSQSLTVNELGPLVSSPEGVLAAICGLAGTGKSRTLNDLSRVHHKTTNEEGKRRRVILVDQQPLGRNSRSNPATYTGLFDNIRTLFSKEESAAKLGLNASSFSFNSELGACPTCQGTGFIEITLHHLSPLRQTCEACQGRRYLPKALSVLYNGLAIDDVLKLTVSQALDFFKHEKKISSQLTVMHDLGLGYLTLGQPSSTLSGGEAQRIRLASFIAPSKRDRALYLLDEPCLGLHDLDIPCLLSALKALTSQGATVVVAENNPLFLAECEHVIDLGSSTPASQQSQDEAMTVKSHDDILMSGVRTRNLQNLSVNLPKHQLTVISGPSGSGKTALLYETLFKACQRRFAEHLSPYLRDRLSLSGHGDYDDISPQVAAIALTTYHGRGNPRSTVGTLSGISDTLRVLFSRLGKEKGQKKTKFQASDFSFNHPAGACPSCGGLGRVTRADATFWLVDSGLSIFDGAFARHKSASFFFDPQGRHIAALCAAADALGINLTVPWQQLTSEAKSLILDGCLGEFNVIWHFSRGKRSGEHRFKAPWPGFQRLILDTYQQKKDHKKNRFSFDQAVYETDCPECGGLRLNPLSLEVSVGHVSLKTALACSLFSLSNQTKEYVRLFFKGNISQKEKIVCDELMPVLHRQMEQIIGLGLGYLSLSRSADSLSYGEHQRLRLASFLSNRLNHCLFILDEISRGLHPLDIECLLSMVRTLLNRSNTVAIIDHHPMVQNAANWRIELGPESGSRGGFITFMGSSRSEMLRLDQLKHFPEKKNHDDKIVIEEAAANNLKGIHVEIPSRGLTVLCGVSGSGKTSLLRDVIGQSVLSGRPVNCGHISGLEQFSAVYSILQQGSYTEHRERVIDLITMKKNITSYFGNPKLTPCPHCQGEGEIVTDLDYMGSFVIECFHCQGTGYDPGITGVKKRGSSLLNVLRSELDALPKELITEFKMEKELAMLKEFSLGYLSLSRRVGSLSGGELKRMKTAKTFLKLDEKPVLLLLDEPDGGLAMKECQQLMDSLHRHLDNRHAALLVTHHPLFMTGADWLIELGPGAGEAGGTITAQGTPWEIVNGDWPLSPTAKFLKQVFQDINMTKFSSKHNG